MLLSSYASQYVNISSCKAAESGSRLGSTAKHSALHHSVLRCSLLHAAVQKLVSYLKLARIHNMVPSMLLVVVGAWVSVAAAAPAPARHDSPYSYA